MELRLKRLLRKIDKSSLDACLISSEPNVAYLTGFKGGESIAIVSPKECYFLTDFRYIEEAQREVVSDFKIELRAQRDVFKSINALVKRLSIKHLGFEKAHLSYAVYERLKDILRGVKLIPTADLVEGLRMVKDDEELKVLKEAADIALMGVNYAMRSIKPGETERQVAAELEYFFKTQGADRASFDTIVAGGCNSSMPHAVVTDSRIKKNALVLIDAGVRLKGYNSDLTRTLFLGRMTEKVRKIYKTVSDAQRQAIDRVRPGIRLSEIDKAGRSIIEGEGLGKYFGHSLGHGIGLEVHEKPRIAKNEKGILKEGMVFTIEPGVYIPGWGGVRIEDMVVVTKQGCELLTK